MIFRKQNSVEFQIPYREITRNKSEQLYSENSLAKKMAQPLFDAAVNTMGIAQKINYDSGSLQSRKNHIFMLLLQGEMTIRFGDGAQVQKSGSLFFCPAGVPFARANKSTATWWVYVDISDSALWEPLKQKGPYVRDYESTDHMLLLASRILDARLNPTILSQLDAMEDSRALAALLKRELRIVAETKPHGLTNAVLRLLKLINEHPEQKWSIAAMAEEAHMSSRTLNRLFQREYGMGPMEVVIQNRLDSAVQMLLTTDYTIEEIARNLNYKSVYSFSTLFKRHLGLRPGQFRRQCREEKS